MKLDNRAVAQLFDDLGSLLELQGESAFRVNAYHRAAETLRGLGRDLAEIAAAGELRTIPGVGEAIAAKIEEILTTGQLPALEREKEKVPATLLDLLKIGGVGPKRAARFWKEMGITDLPGLEAAAKEGRLRTMKGMGPGVEAAILSGMAALARRSDRIPIGQAWPLAQALLARLRESKKVRAAGSACSRREVPSSPISSPSPPTPTRTCSPR